MGQAGVLNAVLIILSTGTNEHNNCVESYEELNIFYNVFSMHCISNSIVCCGNL